MWFSFLSEKVLGGQLQISSSQAEKNRMDDQGCTVPYVLKSCFGLINLILIPANSMKMISTIKILRQFTPDVALLAYEFL